MIHFKDRRFATGFYLTALSLAAMTLGIFVTLAHQANDKAVLVLCGVAFVALCKAFDSFYSYVLTPYQVVEDDEEEGV